MRAALSTVLSIPLYPTPSPMHTMCKDSRTSRLSLSTAPASPPSALPSSSSAPSPTPGHRRSARSTWNMRHSTAAVSWKRSKQAGAGVCSHCQLCQWKEMWGVQVHIHMYLCFNHCLLHQLCECGLHVGCRLCSPMRKSNGLTPDVKPGDRRCLVVCRTNKHGLHQKRTTPGLGRVNGNNKMHGRRKTAACQRSH
jgi:hypothetical protein